MLFVFSYKSPLFLLLLLLPNILGRRKSREKLPIIDSTDENLLSSFSSSSSKKASECKFGDLTFELEETWHPNLGPPFGKMYCVHCECVPIYKKRRIIGRVRCKNIKSECPPSTCSDPVLYPGRCCKVCPNTMENPDLNIVVDLKREEEEKHGKYYAALLRSSTTTPIGSATGRFHYRKKALAYSFVTSSEFGWPSLLSFLDEEGNIIEEFPLVYSSLQRTLGKVCGSWNRLPNRYRKQLLNDTLFVQLTSSSNSSHFLSGRIRKYYGLATELFSSLLTSKTGGSGSAITSLSTSAPGTGSIHMNLLLSGIFSETEIGKENVGLTVRFESKNGHGESRRIQEDLQVPFVSSNVSSIDFNTVFDDHELEALGKGTLSITVFSKTAPELSISDSLYPRFSCDLFDASLRLKGSEYDDNNNNNNENNKEKDKMEEERNVGFKRQDTSLFGHGLAWMLMTKNGHLQYHINLSSHLPSPITSISINNGKKSKRLLKIVSELLPFYSEGQANGTLILSASEIEDLYSDGLYITVTTEMADYELNGRLTSQYKNEAQEENAPILLQGNKTTVTGIGWMSVDKSCTLNYYVRLIGMMDKKEDSLLKLEDYPMKHLKTTIGTAAFFPNKIRTLVSFKGNDVKGQKESLHKLTLARLSSGDAALIVTSQNFELFGQLRGVTVPSTCLPNIRRNEMKLMPGYLSDDDSSSSYMNTKCLYQESYVYEDGQQWTATHTNCTMCSCQRGSVVCDPIVCPPVSCEQPTFSEEGDCCPKCKALEKSEEGCIFFGDKKIHSPGSLWHPYIPPFGFSKCVICQCDAYKLTVSCSTIQCPPLNCSSEQQIRVEPKACCKTCKSEESLHLKSESKIKVDINEPQDMGFARTKEDVLKSGGCDWRGNILENGHQWHPQILPFGEMKCVLCKCKDGQSKCNRRNCSSLNCPYKIQDKNECCPRCAISKSEIQKVKRMNHLSKLKKLRKSHIHNRISEEEFKKK